ncbi:MAG: 50S ribosomal protein L4 [Kiritimatiellia bacterium]|nr:50S ribosomal protein L4 [Kiritimatiellia bacterium]
MSKLAITNIRGEPVGEVEAGDYLVLDRGQQAVKDTVVAHQAAVRAGTASTKTKGTVAGSGKKPWKQKGTGRARAGYKSSPVWRGGGVAFGPKPRDYTKRLNRKVRSLAFRRALSDCIAEGSVSLLDRMDLEAPKTKSLAALIKALGAPRHLLLVTRGTPENIRLSARNLSGVELTSAADMQVYDILRADRIVVLQDAWEQVEARLQADGGRNA